MTIKEAQSILESQYAENPPEGIGEWEYKIGNWEIKDYLLNTVKASSTGLITNNKGLFWWLTIGLGILGGLIYILPTFLSIPGIKNNHIYQNTMTRGLKLNVRKLFLGATIIGVLIYGVSYMNMNWIWPVITVVIIGLIIYLVLYRNGEKENEETRSASPDITGWIGMITGMYLIGFYILLYWKPEYITSWILISDPISEGISGNPASRWFLYGMLYTVIVLVMGIRMIAKYRHNRYQLVRTCSVMFFQTAFAFLIPEIMIKLNQPYFDFKNIWPLNYTFFFDYNINQLMASGGFGIFMLVWGIILVVVGVPVFVYFFGKRWYCSWVCGCGGLAETLGDPYRQLSDKSLRAWKYERYIIHGVLVFAVFMTILVLYTYFSGSSQVLFFNSDVVRSWYGFLIGSAFAGVVGTGFYPLMGNRVWCRFGCPLAAYLGLVQKFKSRFRITTNGSQCISCGNCSTYCEMGIDVRWYAQRGQDIVRSSCVGCGVCSAVCPRGVLRLENASGDIASRTIETRAIHISEEEVTLLS
jgi:polyferredoxin